MIGHDSLPRLMCLTLLARCPCSLKVIDECLLDAIGKPRAGHSGD